MKQCACDCARKLDRLNVAFNAAIERHQLYRMTVKELIPTEERKRLAGLLVSSDREHMRDLGRKGGKVSASVAGRMSELAKHAAAERARKVQAEENARRAKAAELRAREKGLIV